MDASSVLAASSLAAASSVEAASRDTPASLSLAASIALAYVLFLTPARFVKSLSGADDLRLKDEKIPSYYEPCDPEEHKRKGERIEWAVSLTPLRELLALPVRVNHSMRITEDDQAAQAWMQEIGRAQVEDVTLGQVIEGLLWELSFHGGPAEQEAVAEGLLARSRAASTTGEEAEPMADWERELLGATDEAPASEAQAVEGSDLQADQLADAVEGAIAGAAEESTEVAQDIQAAEAAAGETVDPAIEAAAETN